MKVSHALVAAFGFLPLAVGGEVVVFEESFGAPGAEGCVPAFPSGWVRHDVDGKTPNATVAFVDAAWVASADPFDVENCSAASTSWYEPPGAADDWMATPLVHVPMGATLSWRAFSYREDFPDGYELRYSLTGTDPEDFAGESAVLFSIPAEASVWTSRSVNLDDFGLGGRAVHFAFRNPSLDQYLLYLDDVRIAFDNEVWREEFGSTGLDQLCDPIFPDDWLVHDVDGGTPDPEVDFVTEAWVAIETFFFDPADCAAFSTSYYVPADTADDWLVTPPFVVPADADLVWEAVAYEPTAADGYEVRYSTTGSSPADFSAPPLVSIAAENPAWTARSIDLDAAGLRGHTVRIAFRNHSSDKYLLAVDGVALTIPIVFRDGFESGYVGAWSAQVP